MRVSFTKMHGAGNDFVVFDGVNQRVNLTPAQIRRLADRRFGVGCDQVLLVERPDAPGADFRYRIFNADGGEVEQCGNGARCFVRFVRDRGLTQKDEIVVETLGGLIRPRLEPDGEVSVDMGVPRFEPREVPFEAPARAPLYDLDVDGQTVQVSVLSMGNPHAVQLVPDVDLAPVNTQGSENRAPPALSEAGERGLYAGRGPAPHPPAGVRARRRRDARLRQRRLRRGRGRSPTRPA